MTAEPFLIPPTPDVVPERACYELVDWGGWRCHPSTWLLEVGHPALTVRLGSVYQPGLDCLGGVLRRADRLLGLLTDEQRLGLWQVLEDVFGGDPTPAEVRQRLEQAHTREIQHFVSVLDIHGVPVDAEPDHPAAAPVLATVWTLSVTVEDQFDEAQRHRRSRPAQ